MVGRMSFIRLLPNGFESSITVLVQGLISVAASIDTSSGVLAHAGFACDFAPRVPVFVETDIRERGLVLVGIAVGNPVVTVLIKD